MYLPLQVYPGGKCVSKEAFPEAFAVHMKAAHFTKLEGFVSGPFVCGAEPQSADFHRAPVCIISAHAIRALSARARSLRHTRTPRSLVDTQSSRCWISI